jgi:hypothetical protein
VPYACDDWDNAQQIGLHRAVIEAVVALVGAPHGFSVSEVARKSK